MQLNEYDCHEACVACLSPSHFQMFLRNHPCQICRALDPSSYRSRKVLKARLSKPGCANPARGGGTSTQSQAGSTNNSVSYEPSESDRSGSRSLSHSSSLHGHHIVSGTSGEHLGSTLSSRAGSSAHTREGQGDTVQAPYWLTMWFANSL